jgi:hypothetical protein
MPLRHVVPLVPDGTKWQPGGSAIANIIHQFAIFNFRPADRYSVTSYFRTSLLPQIHC